MILLPFEKSPDLITAIAKRGMCLCLFEKSSLRTDRLAAGSTGANSGIFGLQREDGVMVGVTDYVQDRSHHTVRFNIHFEKASDKDIKDAIEVIQKTASLAGVVKLSLVVSSEQDHISDIIRDLGFTPEVRLRHHVFVGGQFMSISEYGCVL